MPCAGPSAFSAASGPSREKSSNTAARMPATIATWCTSRSRCASCKAATGSRKPGLAVTLQHSSQRFGRVGRELQGVVLARRDVRARGAHVAFGDRTALQQRKRAFGRCPQQRAEVFHPFRRERRYLGVKAGAASERRRKLTQFLRLLARAARDSLCPRAVSSGPGPAKEAPAVSTWLPRRAVAGVSLLQQGPARAALSPVASRPHPAPPVRQCARHADSSARTPPRWLPRIGRRCKRPAAANRQRADRALRPDRTSDPDASAAQPSPLRARRRARTCRCASGRLRTGPVRRPGRAARRSPTTVRCC